MKNLTTVVLLGAALAIGWYFLRPQNVDESAQGPGGPPRGARAVPVTTEAVRPESLSETIEAIGTTRANESVTITAKVTDKISAVNFSDGERVSEGALLVELTNAEQTAQLGEAKADLNDARTQLERLQDLAGKGTVSEADLDVARARYSVSAARLEAIIARLQDRVVRAPFAGVLGFRQVSPGTLVSPGTPITTLDDVSSLKLDFDVPEVYLGAVQLGASVRAYSPSWRDTPFVGTVTGIDSRVDEVTRSVTVRATLPNDDARLRPGMLLTVQLVTTERESLAVPEDAVIASDSGAYVYVIGNDSVAERRAVTPGLRSEGLVEIRDGLVAGEEVAVLGLLKLRDGAPVVVRGEDRAVVAGPGEG